MWHGMEEVGLREYHLAMKALFEKIKDSKSLKIPILCCFMSDRLTMEKTIR